MSKLNRLMMNGIEVSDTEGVFPVILLFFSHLSHLKDTDRCYCWPVTVLWSLCAVECPVRHCVFLFCSVAIVTAPPPSSMKWGTSSSPPCVTPYCFRTSSRAKHRRPGDASNAKTSKHWTLIEHQIHCIYIFIWCPW